MRTFVVVALLSFAACSQTVFLPLPTAQGDYWDDLRTSALALNVQGTNGADLVQFMTNFYTLHFDHQVNEYAYLSFQMPHSWKEGSDVLLHLHWSPETNDNGTVEWCARHASASPRAFFNNGSVSCATQTVSGNLSQHLIAPIATINMTGKTLSTIVHVTLWRNATNTADNYGAGAFLHQVDLHYQTDAPGSKAEYVK